MPRTYNNLEMSLVLVLIGIGVVCGQSSPELLNCDHPSAIRLLDSAMCVLPVNSKLTWASAQSTCEGANGKLYQLPATLQNSYSDFLYCVASQPNNTVNNFWINAVAVWAPQFYWVNGSEVSPVKYCTRQAPSARGEVVVESSFLSVDYCVATCHETSASYIVVHNTAGTPQCYCFFLPSAQDAVGCDVTSVSFADESRYFILEAKQEPDQTLGFGSVGKCPLPTTGKGRDRNQGTSQSTTTKTPSRADGFYCRTIGLVYKDAIIRVANTNAANRTEILCATVDTQTHADKLMRSESCFNRRAFICNLGKRDNCPEEDCAQASCRFLWKGDCLKRDNSRYNWYEARTLCHQQGGELWTLDTMESMLRFNQYMTDSIRYWIGASNFRWYNNSRSDAIARHRANSEGVRCGQLHVNRRSGVWGWNQTSCDAQHSFLCQFEQDPSRTSHIDEDVQCPWPIVVTSAVSPRSSTDDYEFPLAAVLSGIVAGLVLLTAFLVGFTYCCRRQWIYDKLKKARQYLAFIPYFADSRYAGQGSGVEFESMSNTPHNMSYMSDPGSQAGLVTGGQANAYTLTTSYRDNSAMFSDKSLDRRHRETMQRKLNDSQNFLASHNTSMDDRAFNTTYSTLLAKSRDVMTLEGEMNIRDDLEGLSGSLRGKPEVTLVTDHADLNFTVNYAVPQGHPDISRVSLDKTMEEVTLPPAEGGMSVPLPERVAEARVITSLAHHDL